VCVFHSEFEEVIDTVRKKKNTTKIKKYHVCVSNSHYLTRCLVQNKRFLVIFSNDYYNDEMR
jgi:hypothetical protein